MTGLLKIISLATEKKTRAYIVKLIFFFGLNMINLAIDTQQLSRWRENLFVHVMDMQTDKIVFERHEIVQLIS